MANTGSNTITPVTLSKRGDRSIHKGITQAAKDLGVVRVHLQLVLSGKRQSKALMERIRALHPELLEDGLRYSPTQSNQPTERDTP